MIKIKPSSHKYQVMMVSKLGYVEFFNYWVALKLICSWVYERRSFVILNKRDKVLFGYNLSLAHLRK